METVGADSTSRWRRGLLPAALVAMGLITLIYGDVTGDHRILAGGVAIIGAAILMAVAGWALRRHDSSAQLEPRSWASYLSQSSEPGFLIVRPDQTELYECAVRAFGAARVMYDRRQRERRRDVSAATIERRRSVRRQRAEADADIKAFGSAWIHA
jgi:hypothetical protein